MRIRCLLLTVMFILEGFLCADVAPDHLRLFKGRAAAEAVQP